MLTKHLNVTFSLVWTLIIANLICVALSLLLLGQLVKLTSLRGSVLIPFVLLLAFIGAYTSNNHIGDLFVLLFFGLVGYLMVRCGWARAPLVLGFVLGKITENNFYISTARYGAAWLLRPIVIALAFLTVVVLVYPFLSRREVGDERSEA
jgi:TctA family transporter